MRGIERGAPKYALGRRAMVALVSISHVRPPGTRTGRPHRSGVYRRAVARIESHITVVMMAVRPGLRGPARRRFAVLPISMPTSSPIAVPSFGSASSFPLGIVTWRVLATTCPRRSTR
jgi:hypothetical protein